jgi:hypothetical protein
VAAAGCSEAMQKKFIRQKKAEPRPSPITQFDDYRQSLTPVDQYRKHYMMFEYWNAQLLDSLVSTSGNAKRVQRASSEALHELRQLVAMVQGPLAAQVQSLLAQREQLDRQLRDSIEDQSQLSLLRQRVELSQRKIHRLMAVSKVEELLKTAASPPDDGLHAR